MTMVFKARTLLQLVRCVYPALYFHFCHIHNALESTRERETIDQVCEKLPPINFSKRILEKIVGDSARSIAVFPVNKVFWSDLGSRERVLRVRRRLGQGRIGRGQGVPGSISAERAVEA
jgi:mannose-1-phosphate guanylyltransferase